MASPTLQYFSKLSEAPGHCVLHRQDNRMHEPFILAGEHVIVDPDNRELVEGELYLIQQRTRQIIWQVSFEGMAKKVAPEVGPCAMLHPLALPGYWERQQETIGPGIPFMGFCSDGPITAAQLTEDTIGHVIGVCRPTEAKH